MTSTIVTAADRVAVLHALGAPASRRDMWLMVAAAVAEGLPEPHGLSLHDQIVVIDVDTSEQVTAWGTWLGAGYADEPRWMPTLKATHHGWYAHEHPTGWSWQIHASVPGRAQQSPAQPTPVPAGVEGHPIGGRT